jgi:catechol 2,3-dioxygenase-like lactoylglutathione lyase family enzyme
MRARMGADARARRVVDQQRAAADQAPVAVEMAGVQVAAAVRHAVVLREHGAAHVLGERPRRGLPEHDRDHRLPEARPQLAGVGVGGDQHALGGDRARGRADAPGAAGVGDAGRRRAAMDARAGALRRAGEAAGERQRINMAALRMPPAAVVADAAEDRRERLAVEELGRRAAPLPLLDAAAGQRDAARPVRRLDPTGLHRVAVDLQAAHQVEQELRAVAHQRDQLLARLGADQADHAVGVVAAERRDDQAVVASRGAPARLLRLQHHRVDARLGQVQRRGKAGEAATDDRHVGAPLAFERRAVGRRRRGRRPERVGHPLACVHRRQLSLLSFGMANGIDGIDHLVVLVRDLDRARDSYQRLGFRTTPRGTHSAHMGTGNYLMMLERDYIELLGVMAPTPNNAEWRTRLDGEGEGLAAMALATDDHMAAHASLAARGLSPLPPLEFSRPVEIDGQMRDAAFAVIRLPTGRTPLGLFVCGHKTRELVWRKEWQSHPNTATRIVSITLPEQGRAQWARALPLSNSGRLGEIAVGRHKILLSGNPRITFGDADFAAASRALSRGGVPHTIADGTAIVAPAHAHGVEIAFTRS